MKYANAVRTNKLLKTQIFLQFKKSALMKTFGSEKKVTQENRMYGSPSQYTGWFIKMNSILYVYISRTIHGMWMIYITFERGGPKFSHTTAWMFA